MHIARREHRTNLVQSLQGIGLVVLLIVSLLAVMEILVVAIRFFVA